MPWIVWARERLQYFFLLHGVRRLPYRHKGTNVQLFNGSLFCPPEKIWLGSDIYIGAEARFYADGGLTIHDNVILSPRVTIFTSNHKVEGADFLPYGPLTELGPVTIYSHVWIGAGCLILPGVQIGEGAVCAAGSVVSQNVPPLAFVAGNPAEVKRYRDPQRYLQMKKEGRFYMPYKRDHATPGVFVERAPRHGLMRHTPAALKAREQLRLDDYPFEGGE